MKLRSDYGVKKGLRGARDYKEQQRREAIAEPFWAAIEKKDVRLFWKAISCAGMQHDDPRAIAWYEKFRELIGELPPHNSSEP